MRMISTRRSGCGMTRQPAPGSPCSGCPTCISAVRAGAPAVVAVVGDDLVGTAVATVSGARAVLMRISLAPGWRRRGVGSAMLTELERRLVAAGVHRIACLLADESEMGAVAPQPGDLLHLVDEHDDLVQFGYQGERFAQRGRQAGRPGCGVSFGPAGGDLGHLPGAVPLD
jgi:GNAT superfamily N-acetyltransferase